MADGSSHAVGAGVAAADDDDVLAGRRDRGIGGVGSRVTENAVSEPVAVKLGGVPSSGASTIASRVNAELPVGRKSGWSWTISLLPMLQE